MDPAPEYLPIRTLGAGEKPPRTGPRDAHLFFDRSSNQLKVMLPDDSVINVGGLSGGNNFRLSAEGHPEFYNATTSSWWRVIVTGSPPAFQFTQV